MMKRRIIGTTESICVPTQDEFHAWFDKLAKEATTSTLAELPAAGGGLNGSIPSATHALKHFYAASELIDLFDTALREKRGSNYRPGEAERQVNFALNSDNKGTGESRKVEPDWPDFEPDLSQRLEIPECSVYDLWDRSPIRFEDGVHTREILRAVFPCDPLLCFARKYSSGIGYDAQISRLSKVTDRQLLEWSYVVPNVPGAEWGFTKDGKESQHSKDLFQYRNYIIVEFDGTVPDKDKQASIILWLAEHWGELTLVVDSGGKSLHAWFYCGGIADDALEPHFRQAVRLGEDSNLFDKMQFVRLPDGLRENGNRQQTLYFKP
jgi:hypothetical protein